MVNCFPSHNFMSAEATHFGPFGVDWVGIWVSEEKWTIRPRQSVNGPPVPDLLYVANKVTPPSSPETGATGGFKQRP